MTKENENLLLDKILKTYPLDEEYYGLDISKLSCFFVDGHIDWTYLLFQRKFREVESVFGDILEEYKYLSIIEEILFKSGVCTDNDRAVEKQMDNFLVVRVISVRSCGNVHEEGLLFAEEDDACAFLWAWVDENYEPEEVEFHKFVRRGNVNVYDVSIKSMPLNEVPRSAGYNWLEKDFPIAQNE